MRGLTHRAVDEHAGLPGGSTSNLYRTRASLIQAILGRILDRELVLWADLAVPAPGVEEFADLLVRLFDELTTTHRSLVVARHTVLTEPGMPAVEADAERRVAAWAEAQLLALGSRTPRSDGRIMLALMDGLLAAATTSEAHLDVPRAARSLLRGLLADGRRAPEPDLQPSRQG